MIVNLWYVSYQKFSSRIYFFDMIKNLIFLEPFYLLIFLRLIRIIHPFVPNK